MAVDLSIICTNIQFSMLMGGACLFWSADGFGAIQMLSFDGSKKCGFQRGLLCSPGKQRGLVPSSSAGAATQNPNFNLHLIFHLHK